MSTAALAQARDAAVSEIAGNAAPRERRRSAELQHLSIKMPQPSPPHLQHQHSASSIASPSPSLSPSPSTQQVNASTSATTPARGGKRLHHRMMEELRTRAHRSPMHRDTTATAPAPPVLSLNMPSDPSEQESNEDTSPHASHMPVEKNAKAKGCGICERSFTVFHLKHTCKLCRRKICDECSKHRRKLNRRLERSKGSRLCDRCASMFPEEDPALLARTASNGDLEEQRPSESVEMASTKATETSEGPDTARLVRRASFQTVLETAGTLKHAATRLAHGLTETRPTYLRPRHWYSLAGLSCLLFLRIVRFQLATPHRVGSILLALTNWVDIMLSFRVVTSCLIGLVVYDELVVHPKDLSPGRPSAAGIRKRSRSLPRLSQTPRSKVSSSRGSVATTPPEHEVVRVEVGDKATDAEEGFVFDKMVATLMECSENDRTIDGEIKMRPFLAACTSICIFMHVFGRATSFAASTVKGYFASIDKILATWPPVPTPDGTAGDPTNPSWKEQSLRAIVEREVALGIAAIGGKKNPSVCRCVLRLLWFVEFVAICTQYSLIDNLDENCAAGASKAYEESLGLRHPWIIRKGVNSALGSLPTRSTILRSLNLHELSRDEAVLQLKRAQEHMAIIHSELQALFKKHALMEIK